MTSHNSANPDVPCHMTQPNSLSAAFQACLKSLAVYTMIIAVCLSFATSAQADVTIDLPGGGTLALAGPDFVITDAMGQISGTSLFHSLGELSIESNQSATFTGPSTIRNIVTRITGGQVSEIDGTMGSDIQGANLFLLNPAGFLFGSNASLNLTGSFYAAAADYVRLGQNGKFGVIPDSETVLTSDAPSAFGFLDSAIGSVTVNGSVLKVKDGKTLAIAGGGVTVTEGVLCAPSGVVSILSAASAGEASITNSGISPSGPDGNELETLGDVTLSATYTRQVGGSDTGTLDASGASSGRIQVRGGKITMSGARIFDNSVGGTTSGGIDLAATGDVVLKDSSAVVAANTLGGTGAGISIQGGNVSLSGSTNVHTEDSGSSSGGSISVKASGSLSLDGVSAVTTTNRGSGSSSPVTLECESLTMKGGSKIATSVLGTGDGSDISVTASETVRLEDGGARSDLDYTGIYSLTESDGDAAAITLKGKVIEIVSGCNVGTIASGAGASGAILVSATKSLLVSDRVNGKVTQIAAVLDWGSTGAGSDITVKSPIIKFDKDAELNALVRGSGNGGTVTFEGTDIIFTGNTDIQLYAEAKGNAFDFNGSGSTLLMDKRSNVFTNTFGRNEAWDLNNGVVGDGKFTEGEFGDGGSVDLRFTKSITLNEHPTGFDMRTFGDGRAGKFFLSTPVLDITNGARLMIGAYGTGGPAGDAYINADYLTVTEGSLINCAGYGSGTLGNTYIKSKEILFSGAETEYGGKEFEFVSSGISSFAVLDIIGGSINIETENLTILRGASVTGSTLGTGKASDINIKATGTILVDGAREGLPRGISSINSATEDRGDAGNIAIEAGKLIVSDTAFVAASTGLMGGWYVNGELMLGGDVRGQGGNLNIKAGSIEVDRGSITTSSGPTSKGASGDMDITVDGAFTITGRAIDPYTNTFSQVASSTASDQPAGDVRITAGSLTIDGADLNVQSMGGGNAGTLSLSVGDLTVKNGAVLSTAASGSGNSGMIIINSTGDVAVEGAASAVLSSTSSTGSGGSIDITAGGVSISESGIISGSATSTGGAGSVRIKGNTVDISSAGRLESSSTGAGEGGIVQVETKSMSITGEGTGIFSTSTSTGGAGMIKVEAETIAIDVKGTITASATGAGDGGSIEMKAKRIDISGEGGISSESSDAGEAGNVEIGLDGPLKLTDSSISTQALKADGGNIKILGTGTIEMIRSSITAEVKAEAGNGGNVEIARPRWIVLESSRIIANAYEGSGGNISIDAQAFIPDTSSVVSASSRLGIDGVVEIQSPDVDITGSIVELPTNMLDASQLLPKKCSSRTADETGSFTIGGRGGLPPDPAAGMMSSF